jgi:hypothetical protein
MFLFFINVFKFAITEVTANCIYVVIFNIDILILNIDIEYDI